jgi:hypothetical protein
MVQEDECHVHRIPTGAALALKDLANNFAIRQYLEIVITLFAGRP